MSARLKLEGQKFGKLTVSSFESVKNKRTSRWKCVCDCGNFVTVNGSDLKRGHVKSCGCFFVKYPNLEGKCFGRLTVVDRIKGHGKWKCVCECGNTVEVPAYNLVKGLNVSCGCYGKTILGTATFIHGQSRLGRNAPEYLMWKAAKARARKYGLPFDIRWTDINIPEYCPVFPEIKLTRIKGKMTGASPTLDRLIPNLGYVKNNVQVISSKANLMKSNATVNELRRIADWLEGKIHND